MSPQNEFDPLEAVASRVRAMTPPGLLRLAANLLEQKQPQLAHDIAEQVVLELGYVLAKQACTVTRNDPTRIKR